MFHLSDYITTATICNLLHSPKIDSETSKMSNVQIHLNVASKVLQVNLELADTHICNAKEYTYKLVNKYRNTAHDTTCYNENYTTLLRCLHNFTIDSS
jgi:hypothetical protein